MKSTLRVILANSSVRGGGAETVCRDLSRSLRAAGHETVLAVGSSRSREAVLIPNKEERAWLTRSLLRSSESVAGRRRSLRGAGTISRALQWLAEPIRDSRKRLGHEDFYFPGTKRLLDLAPFDPDILHVHNLHGGYFDLRELPSISRRVPLAITLHDQWLMTGHCAYSLECERWREGCGSCPHLETYPAIPRDATRGNLARKSMIYGKSRLYVSAPSQWLLNQIPDSVLASAIHGVPRLIPNGVDQTIFSPSDRAAARDRLKLPLDKSIIAFAANLALSNPYKDWPSLREALRLIGDKGATEVLAFAIGENGTSIEMGTVRVESVPRVEDRSELADWYRAADLFVQPSAADNHPLTVLESLSCGTPVVASAVGGIPEQIHHLAGMAGATTGGVDLDVATGVLVAPGDPAALAKCLTSLVEDRQRLARLGANAAYDAKHRFDFDRYVSDTLDWYDEILLLENQSIEKVAHQPHEAT
jgi:glycosyltransferase involved in cell wall biosynthesis